MHVLLCLISINYDWDDIEKEEGVKVQYNKSENYPLRIRAGDSRETFF